MKKIARLSFLLTLFFMVGCSQPTESTKITDNPHGLSDHGHDHAPHMGVIATLKDDSSQSGVVELKLHDDKGDLELWLTKDIDGKEPLDIPLNAVIKVEFPKLEGRTVELKVRNTETNEDEDGNANIRDGKTNYFIFPGDTGADASFLLGKHFTSEAILSFELDGKLHKTDAFILAPHIH